MELMYSSVEDKAFYEAATKGLPTLAGFNGTGKDKNGVPLPFGLGPHSVRCLREIVDIVQPKSIFEIGFNMGWSSALWLELCDAEVVSCDISFKEETVEAARVLEQRYSRFKYVNRTMKADFFQAVLRREFDMAFIDGGHMFHDVTADLSLCLTMRIPYLAMDDWLPQYGEIQKAVDYFGEKLKVLSVNGNIALLKNQLSSSE